MSEAEETETPRTRRMPAALADAKAPTSTPKALAPDRIELTKQCLLIILQGATSASPNRAAFSAPPNEDRRKKAADDLVSFAEALAERVLG